MSGQSTLHTTFTVFVPGRLRNPMNGSHGHWSGRARWARQWREKTHAALIAEWNGAGRPIRWNITQPKWIMFHARVWNLFDDDGLRASLKGCRDALRDCGFIVDDGPTWGHEFVYTQEIRRDALGVQITVELRG